MCGLWAFSPSLEPVISFSCAEQRFVIQIKSNLSIFLLWIMLLVSHLRILHQALGLKDFLQFSSKHFIVLHLTSKSVTCFELILYKVWGLGQSFFLFCYFIHLFLPTDAQLFQCYLLKTALPLLNCFGLSAKTRWACLHGLFQGFLFCSTELCWSLHQHHTPSLLLEL